MLLTGLMTYLAVRGVGRERTPVLILLLWVLVPLSFLRPSARHFALAFPAFMLLATRGIQGLSELYRRVAAAICAGLMLLFCIFFSILTVIPQRCTFQRDFREAAMVFLHTTC